MHLPPEPVLSMGQEPLVIEPARQILNICRELDAAVYQ